MVIEIATGDGRSVLENSGHSGIKIFLDDGFSLRTWASKKWSIRDLTKEEHGLEVAMV